MTYIYICLYIPSHKEVPKCWPFLFQFLSSKSFSDHGVTWPSERETMVSFSYPIDRVIILLVAEAGRRERECGVDPSFLFGGGGPF